MEPAEADEDDCGATTASDEEQQNAAIASLCRRWKGEHEQDAEKRAKLLLDGAPDAKPDERLLLEVAAKDLALGDSLWQAQVQLAGRISVLIDNAKVVLQLSRALHEVTACRAATTKRSAETLLIANTLRVQRRLANIHSIRRVA